MKIRYLVPVIAGAVLGAASAHCNNRQAASNGAEAAAVTTYTARGVIKAIDVDQKTILIAHEEIPGYMKAMTMQFDLRDAAVARGCSVGDPVSFMFTDDGRGKLVVQSIQRASS